MYLYFDAQGVLKEVVNDAPIRQGSTHNYLYIYMAGVNYDGSKYPLPSAYTSGNMSYLLVEESDRTTDTQAIADLEAVKVTGEIPFDKKRDLKFFGYGVNYQFWKIEVKQSLTLNKSGTISCTLQLYPGTVALGLIIFDIEAGAMLETVPLNQAQYNYLLDQFVNVFVHIEANPTEQGTQILNRLKIGSVIYELGGGGGSAYTGENGVIVNNITHKISADTDVLATKTDLTSYATTTQLNNKLDKTGTTQEVEESANFGIAFVDDIEEVTSSVLFEVLYTESEKSIVANVVSIDGTTISGSGITIEEESVSIASTDGTDNNAITITKDDATLTTMGESDNSIAIKEYVDDVREIAEGKVQAITVSNTDTLASIKAYLENVSIAKAYLENGVEITASIKSGETYLVLNNLFTNDGISTDYIMLQSTGYVASQKNNDYYFYKADNNGLLAKKGNEILITQTNVPDWWSDGYQTVAGTTGIKVRLLETRKVDLSNYRTSAQQDVIDNGKQPLINSTNKLNPAYVNTDSSNRFVSDSEKSTWNGKLINSLTGTTQPTTSTEGQVGQFYIFHDTTTDTYKLYVCVAVSSGTYTWQEAGVDYRVKGEINYYLHNVMIILTDGKKLILQKPTSDITGITTWSALTTNYEKIINTFEYKQDGSSSFLALHYEFDLSAPTETDQQITFYYLEGNGAYQTKTYSVSEIDNITDTVVEL